MRPGPRTPTFGSSSDAPPRSVAPTGQPGNDQARARLSQRRPHCKPRPAISRPARRPPRPATGWPAGIPPRVVGGLGTRTGEAVDGDLIGVVERAVGALRDVVAAVVGPLR